MERDSRYYEALFESLFPTLKRFDLKEEIQKVIDELKTIFKDIDIEYQIRYGRELVFCINKINTYQLSRFISFDLSRLGIQHKDDLKNMIVPEIKYVVLEYWDSKILK
ncbi:MAG: hypothetical protein IJK18_01530 [Clostridia bacterium]|nr:hypothetical protein [Clostridia bacterium]